MYQYDDNDLIMLDLSIYQLNFDMMYLIYFSNCNAGVLLFIHISQRLIRCKSKKLQRYGCCVKSASL